MSSLLTADSYSKSKGIDLTAKKTSIDIGKSTTGHYLTTNKFSFNFNPNRKEIDSENATQN